MTRGCTDCGYFYIDECEVYEDGTCRRDRDENGIVENNMTNREWILMKDEEPTIVEEEEQFSYNYALVMNTEYDCIGNYLCGGLCKLVPQKRVFEFVYEIGKSMEIKFEDVIAWYRVPPFIKVEANPSEEK